MGVEKHDMSYYGKCMLGGVLSCGLTHTAVCPLDIAKCRMQTNPELYQGLIRTLKALTAKEGTKWMSLGWAPTFFGYSMQGFGKFGFYEIFKDVYKNIAGDKAEQFRFVGWLASAACAEVIADVFLCPMESVKVRIQTSPEGTFPKTLREGFPKIMEAEGINGFYKGLAPLWLRQVPYTMMKFSMFERTVVFCYDHIFTAPKESYSKGQQLTISFLSGYWAGIFCAIVSHPADTIVSKLNQIKTKGSNVDAIKQIINNYGIVGLATKGLVTRIIMIGTLTGLQWWIYDSFKSFLGLQTTGGGSKK